MIEDASVAAAQERTVADIPDDELVRRALNAAVNRGPKRRYAWAKVQDAFLLGSTYSWQLLERFGLDPETGKPLNAALSGPHEE